MNSFNTVLNQFLKFRITQYYGLVSMLTAGGEYIFSVEMFSCPCSIAWNRTYGVVFLLVPALALFLLGFVLSVSKWPLFTCCCICKCGSQRHSGFLEFVHLGTSGAIASLTWMVAALLDGNFFECAASGTAYFQKRLCRDLDTNCTVQLPLVPCGLAKPSEVQELLKELKARSQVLGWGLLAAVIFIVLIFAYISRCLCPVSILQLKFRKSYVEQEQKKLKTQVTNHAIELAEKNVKRFFDSSSPRELNTLIIKDWQQITSLYDFNPSMLQKFINRKEKSHRRSSKEPFTSDDGFAHTEV